MNRLTCVLLGAGVLIVSGCSTEQAYHSVRGMQINECNKLVDTRERQRCLERITPNYDEYRKQTASPEPAGSGQ